MIYNLYENSNKGDKIVMIKKIMQRQLVIRRFFMLICDIFIIIISSIVGLLLRFDLTLSKVELRFLDSIWGYLPVYIIGSIIIFYIFKLYHSLWTFAGIIEMQNVVTACAISSVFQAVGMHLLQYQVPRSYYFLSAGVLVFLMVGSRFAYRLLRSFLHRKHNVGEEIKVMVIGGGDAGNLIIKEILTSKHITNTTVKCVIDDAVDKQGSYIQGIKVVGTRRNIIEYANHYNIDEIIIAMPSTPKTVIKEIINICKNTKCTLKILPGVYQLMNGEVSISKLRKVDVEDLLGREAIKVDLDSIMNYVSSKVVMITGGGGSIGSELCRQMAAYVPKQLIIVDIYENNAYEIQQELLKKYPSLDLVVLIASVRNKVRIENIFKTYKPDIVYHAAAHKHVPLMETSPNEAIRNNVLGTWNTVVAADKFGVSRFVMISTDKAVNPTNIMGASKRICEMIIQMYNTRSKTEFVAVRFGNVLGSNGSVIPLFKKQIAAGGPVTVTHPDIIRYFMTIPEAVSLVLQAGAYASGGEIFVLDMGEPVKIVDLATNLIRLSGYIPGEEIEIQFTGLRPGEKLYEELLMKEEGMQDTANKLIHIGKPIQIDEGRFLYQLEELEKICEGEPEDIRGVIQEIVPTYVTRNDLAKKEERLAEFQNNLHVGEEIRVSP